MNFTIIRKLATLSVFACLFLSTAAQSGNEAVKEFKPYRILTSGKTITIKSSKDIQSIMVWTTSGHRIVEQRDINASSFSFTISVNEKIFFLMMELKGEKKYTEKIGVQ